MTDLKKRKIYDVLPEISWKTITPPYPRYSYFQDCEFLPFQYEAKDFNLVNAWWLIEAAILAYSEEVFIREKLLAAGLPEMKFFCGFSTQCYVANNDHFVIVVFRGTEINPREGFFDLKSIIADIAVDSNIFLVKWEKAGKVHKGFKAALNEVWEEKGLWKYIQEKDDGKRTVWFAGHSLGAALATLAAVRYGDVRGLYTFGSPRVGEEEFVKNFSVTAFRVVNNQDIVTKLPPPIIYRHVGTLKHLNGQGLLQENSSATENSSSRKQIEVADIPRTGIGILIPEAILDHVPLIYSVYLWNNAIA